MNEEEGNEGENNEEERDIDYKDEEEDYRDIEPTVPSRIPIRRDELYDDLSDIDFRMYTLDKSQLTQQFRILQSKLDTSNWRYSNISRDYLDIEGRGIVYRQFLEQIEKRLKNNEIEFCINVLLKAFKEEHNYIDNNVIIKAKSLFENLILVLEKQTITIESLLRKYGGVKKMVDETELKYRGALVKIEDMQNEINNLSTEINRLKNQDINRQTYVRDIMNFSKLRVKEAMQELGELNDEVEDKINNIFEKAKEDIKEKDLEICRDAGIEEKRIIGEKESEVMEEKEEEKIDERKTRGRPKERDNDEKSDIEKSDIERVFGK